MAKSLQKWVQTDVKRVKNRSMKWISEEYFFRDPCRPMFCEPSVFFSPADGIIVYQDVVAPDACIVDIKGKPYSLQVAFQDPAFDKTCLVIGIFMTMYDAHINRVPYPGFLSYRPLDPISTFNYPMLDVEKSLVDDLLVDNSRSDYLHTNQRVLNRIYAPDIEQYYYVLQLADYDVDCITPFNLQQNAPFAQNQRFSQIRFGSQVDLVIPLSDRFDFEAIEKVGTHVEGGIDPLVRISAKA